MLSNIKQAIAKVLNANPEQRWIIQHALTAMVKGGAGSGPQGGGASPAYVAAATESAQDIASGGAGGGVDQDTIDSVFRTIDDMNTQQLRELAATIYPPSTGLDFSEDTMSTGEQVRERLKEELQIDFDGGD